MNAELGPEAEFREYEDRRKWNEIYIKMRLKSMNNDHSLNDCKLPQYRGRNRYRDVYPYDHSRVRLKRDDIDYINANLVEAPQAGRKYILTQGPLMETCGHFWLMVWEQNSKAVLMLNKIIEKGTVKCHRYYPLGVENGAEDELTFPDVDLRVEYISEDTCQHYTIRKLQLHDLRTSESREVLHFHYTAWADFDVPSSPNFLDFLESVRESGALSAEVGPPVIHCSAGIGRSGTFCLVDTCLVLIERSPDVKSLSVLDLLLEMRQYRMGLIQTADQLRFSYLAILEGAKRILPNYCATPDSGYQDRSSNMSNSNGLTDRWLHSSEEGSESTDSDIPSDPPPPPPPRPESTLATSARVRPKTANAARGRTPPGEGYAPEIPEHAIAAAAAAAPVGAERSREPVAATSETVDTEEIGNIYRARVTESIEKRNKLLDRGVEIRRRKREERQKNTDEQIKRMREKQRNSELWKNRRTKLKPYLYGIVAVVVIGGAWLYKRYYT